MTSVPALDFLAQVLAPTTLSLRTHLSRGWSSKGEESESYVGTPRLGHGGTATHRCLRSAPWRFSQGRFLLVSSLPIRGPRVLLLRGRGSSKDSEKPAVPVCGLKGCHLVGVGVGHRVSRRPSELLRSQPYWSFPL